MLRTAMNVDDEPNTKSSNGMKSETKKPLTKISVQTLLRMNASAANESSKTRTALSDEQLPSAEPSIFLATGNEIVDIDESSDELTNVMDDFSLLRSGKITRSARDSLLLLRMDPPKHDNVQPNHDSRADLIQPPSLDECPSDEQEASTNHDTDTLDEGTDNAAENVAIPIHRQPVDSMKDVGNLTLTTTSHVNPSPTSRPLGLSNRAL
jgi:hypothetical protein